MDVALLPYINIVQTEALCLASVKQCPYSLLYVKNQTKDICIAAVSRDPTTLYCIHPPHMGQDFIKEIADEVGIESKNGFFHSC